MPRAWAHKGENLVHAFRILASQAEQRSIHFDVHDQAIMLAGMACEVLLKSIVVNSPVLRAAVTKNRKQANTEEKDQQKKFYSHDLAALAELASVELSAGQKHIADILTDFISWRGRYVLPTERDVGDLIPMRGSNGLVGLRQNMISIADAETLLDVIIAAVQVNLYEVKASPTSD